MYVYCCHTNIPTGTIQAGFMLKPALVETSTKSTGAIVFFFAVLTRIRILKYISRRKKIKIKITSFTSASVYLYFTVRLSAVETYRVYRL